MQKKHNTIANKLRLLISDRQLQVGDRLPSERELAQRFGASRATIRQAQLQLQELGLIHIKTGSGVYVQEPTSNELDVLPNATALELTEARSMLESEGAALAAINATESELDELSRYIDVMNNALPSNDQLADDADRDFHLAIARMSRNSVIHHTVKMFWRIRTEVEEVKQVYAAVCLKDTGPRGKEHSDILDALKRRDPMAARVAMRAHFFRLLESMLDVSTTHAIEEVYRQADRERQRFLVNPAISNFQSDLVAD